MSANQLQFFHAYNKRLTQTLESFDYTLIERFCQRLLKAWQEGAQVFFCGNGGSAANAIHLANDFIYGVDKPRGIGLRVNALPANQAVATCLGNDEGYDKIFSAQLAVLGRPGDVLVCLSGSGNSPNILKAMEQAKNMGIDTVAILGYSGGKAKAMADLPLHFAIDDMQISEDLQQIVGHMAMRWLYERRPQ